MPKSKQNRYGRQYLSIWRACNDGRCIIFARGKNHHKVITEQYLTILQFLRNLLFENLNFICAPYLFPSVKLVFRLNYILTFELLLKSCYKVQGDQWNVFTVVYFALIYFGYWQNNLWTIQRHYSVPKKNIWIPNYVDLYIFELPEYIRIRLFSLNTRTQFYRPWCSKIDNMCISVLLYFSNTHFYHVLPPCALTQRKLQ